ncbi:MAG: hypothetical protein RLZZ546_563 [Bacteroidota bacterium]|jgi:DNA sulfur modification protein DndD
MRITKLCLTNYKQYRDETIFEFNLNPPKNLYLIGGLNGFGKSTILEGLYLGLFGKEGFEEYKRSNDQEDIRNYKKFMIGRQNNVPTLKDQFPTTKVEVTLFDEITNNEIIISRKWTFIGRDGQEFNGDEELTVIENNSTTNKSKYVDDQAQEWIDQQMIPADQIFMYLFDGEQITRQFEDKPEEFIREHINHFLGITRLLELRKDLYEVALDFRKQGLANDKERQEFLKIKSELDNFKIEKDSLNAKLNQLDDEIKLTKQEQTRILKKVQYIKSDTQSSVKQITLNERIKERTKSAKNSVYETLFNSSLCINELSQYIRPLNSILSKDIEFTRWHNNRIKLDNKFCEFNNKVSLYLNQIQDVNLSEVLKIEILDKIKQAWNDIEQPLPVDLNNFKSMEILNSISIEDKVNIINLIEQIKPQNKEHLAQLYSEISDLYTELEAIQFVDYNSETAQMIEEQIIEIDIIIEQKNQQKGKFSYALKEIEDKIQSKEQELNQLNQDFQFSDGLEIEYAENLMNFIVELKQELYVKKISGISKHLTKIYNEFCSKTLGNPERVTFTIEEDGKIMIYERSNRGLDIRNIEFSAGEKQLFVLSFILALSKTTGINFPLIIDTPLARLSYEHRANLIQYFANQSQQIILLTTDTELTSNDYNKFYHNQWIAGTYLLKYNELADGAKITTAHKNQYFN